MYICHIYSSCFLMCKEESLCISILYQSVVGIFGKFPNQHLYQSKFWLLIGKFVGYNQNFDFFPSCQSNLFLVTWSVLANWEISPFAPILCSNLWLVVLLNRKFLLFLSLFGTLAHWLSKPWHFGKFQYCPNKICHFLKSVKGVM